jgi:curved DNA-binding protein CbpA
MRCHYEVLGVALDAEADDIKRAYRRQALLWHPDKNREEGAEEQFRLVQSAYETLSEPQERAWYDSHRDAILRGKGSDNGGDGDTDGYAQGGGGGGFSGSGFSPPPDEFDVLAFFRSGTYRGFGPDARGFYSVFGDVFQRLSAQEARSAEGQGREWCPPPPLGTANTAYAPGVQAFYAFWLNFATVKQYEWLDKYAPHDASGRRERRAMEDENKRLRRLGQREHNDAVRALAEFVQKRDPRHVEFVRAKEAADARRIADADARRKQEKEARRLAAAEARRVAALTEPAEPDPDWMVEALERERLEAAARKGKGKKAAAAAAAAAASTSRQTPADADGDAACVDDAPCADEGAAAAGDGCAAEEAGGSEEDVDLYCAVCRKRFKSDKQWVVRPVLCVWAALSAQCTHVHLTDIRPSCPRSVPQNHEQSRKHLDAVAALRRQLEREERAANGGGKRLKGKPAAAAATIGSDATDEDDATFHDAADAAAPSAASRGSSKAARRKAAKLGKRFPGSAAARAASSGSDDDAEEELAEELQAKAKLDDGGAVDPEGDANSDAAFEDAAAYVSVHDDDSSGDDSDGATDEAGSADQQGPESGGAQSASAPHAHKARRNKNKKTDAGAAAAAAAGAAASETTCVLCGLHHDSRSALFRHLKAEHPQRGRK